MSQDDSRKPQDDFDARLRRARDEARSRGRVEEEEGKKGPVSEGIGLAVRIGAELVAALAVGVGIGYVLDRWLGTTPWLMVVFFFLGAAAGVLNVYRAASGIGLAPGYRDRDDEERPGDGDKPIRKP